MSLQSRFNRVFLGAFLVMATIFVSVHMLLQRAQVETMMDTVVALLDTLVERDRQALANEIFEGRQAAIALRLEQMMTVEYLQGIALYDSTQELIDQAGEIAIRPLPRFAGVEHHWREGGGAGLHYLHAIVLGGERWGTIHFRYDLANLTRQQRYSRWLLIAQLAALLAVLVFILQHMLRRSVVQPVAALRDGIRRAGAGETAQPVPVVAEDELGDLAQAFNAMVHERAQAEAALRSSEENLQVILSSIADAVIAIDTDGRILRSNPAAQQLMAQPAEVLVGQRLGVVLRLTDAAGVPWTPAQETGTSRREDLLLLEQGDGEALLLAATWAPLTAADAEVGLVLVLRDITEQKRMEEQLRQSEKMQAIGQLAGGVAHDFNNMLQAIGGHAELVASRPEAAARAGSMDHIRAAVARAKDLIGKLLVFSRKEQARVTVIDCHAVIRDTLAMLAPAVDRRIVIETDLAAERSSVHGDANQLQNALLNLGVNARDAIAGGGRIRFTTRVQQLDAAAATILQGDARPGAHIEIAVEDTGSGIPEHVRKRMFEPFFTTKATGKGTGLGLAAVFGTVQAMRGGIAMSSSAEVGTELRLYLPLSEQSVAAAVAAAAAEPAASTGGRQLLLVDDEEPVREVLAMMLEDLGHRVLALGDAEAALQHLLQAPGAYDAVILDLNMPGMNGADCFHRLRAIRPDLPIIIATGFPDEELLAPLHRAGLSGVLRKPFEIQDVDRHLTALFGTGG